MIRESVERWLGERWYGGTAPGLGLRALAGLYRFGISRRPAHPLERLDAPVIVVGNFTAGGTGKTPVVIALAEYFAGKGFSPGIVSRGHGRTTSAPVRVDDTVSADQCGDEPKLMFERTGLPVFVDADRVAAANAAIAAGCDLVIADDGLQHRRLPRDLEIEVVDGARGYGNGLLIPAGPLRELPRKCDLRIVNGADAVEPGNWRMDLELGDAVRIAQVRVSRALNGFSGCRVHAVAGIGNPARFFASLAQAGLDAIAHPFPDHHRYTPADFAGMQGPILMTEKDAVKCRDFGLADAWSVPLFARLPEDFMPAVEMRLKERHGCA